MFGYLRPESNSPSPRGIARAPLSEADSTSVRAEKGSGACRLPSSCLDEIRQIFRQGFVCGIRGQRIELEYLQGSFARAEFTGVFLEGLAMGAALLDAWTPWRSNHWHAVRAAGGDRYVYQAHVGLGMAIARANQHPGQWLAELDPLMRWLVVDGYGFHQGIFVPARYIHNKELPYESLAAGHMRRVFDQGLGRSLWFALEASVADIIETIAGFPPSRQRDLWAGVGVAATLAGGAQSEQLTALLLASDRHRTHLAQGAAFAAHIQQRTGACTAQADRVCKLFCRMATADAAEAVESALRRVSHGGPKRLHETWQSNVRKSLARALK